MAETIDIPKVGPVKTWHLAAVGGAVVAYVVWSYWRSGRSVSEEAVPLDPGFEGGEVLPSVPGAFSPGGGGIPDDEEPPSPSQFGFHGTTNSEWSQYVLVQLTQADRWQYQDIAAALGNYLAGKPLSSTDQQIVQAAIAVAGYPPVGQFQIKPGGEVPLTVAPTGLKASGVFENSFTLTWSGVPGADEYVVYEGATKAHTTENTHWYVSGRKAATNYGPFTVKGVSPSGVEGPASAPVFVTTSGTPPIRGSKPVGAPQKLHALDIERTSIDIGWNAVTGARHYEVYQNGRRVYRHAGTYHKATSLKPNTSYSFYVIALDAEGKPGPKSETKTYRTKK